MEKIELRAKTRDLSGKKVRNLRKQGLLPAVLYGHGIKPQSLSLNLKEFQKVFTKAGTSALVDLVVDQESCGKIIIHDLQKHPLTEAPLHVDLYKIKMTEKVETEIPLEFTGIAPAVKELEGNLIINKNHLKIRCLPSDLVSKIEVDLSGLKTFDDLIHIKDLRVPPAIEVLDDSEEVVALVEPPRSEEELKAMEEEAAAEAEKTGIEKIEAEAEREKAAKEEAKEGIREEGKEEKPETEQSKEDNK